MTREIHLATALDADDRKQLDNLIEAHDAKLAEIEAQIAAHTQRPDMFPMPGERINCAGARIYVFRDANNLNRALCEGCLKRWTI